MARKRSRTGESRVAYPRPLEAQRRGDHWWVEAEGVEVRLSNLDKVYWPEDGYTKGDLIGAYLNLAPSILPHLRNRPLTLWRMPDGIDGDSFFEKQAPAHTPEWMPTAHIEGHGSRGSTDFLLAQDLPSLLYVANLGCIEMHPMHSRQQRFDRPDYAFFDLDPFEPITFKEVRRVALLVKVALEGLGLTGYAKTSGATGMQVMLPLDGSHTYDEARAFVERVCRVVHRAWPDRTTMEWEISKRDGKVFLDYAMVSEGRNIGSVYSVRAKPGAPVSTPLRWEEVEEDIDPRDFTIENIFDRLNAVGDLFAPVLRGGTPEGYRLDAAMADLGIDLDELRKNRPAEPEPETEPGPGPKERLATYARMRDPKVTPEPFGEAADREPSAAEAKRDGPLYMIHKHHARRLHYDLRLERNGVLVSWAVPKGLPEEPGVRRLAVHVEDHPLEYGSFEGTIPEGQYGAGETRIFDEGTYEVLEWKENKVSVRLHGERLKGTWHLAQTDGKNWIVFRSSKDPLPPREPPPASLRPMLATPGGKPFDDPGWVFEVKWDGWRALASFESGRVTLASRNGNDLTSRFPELHAMADALSATNGLVDGEIVCMDEDGRPSFERLQQRMGFDRPAAAERYPAEFVAFDLVWLDGESLASRPLEERRALLERHLVPGGRLQISPQVPERGTALFAAAKERGLEGVIAKRLGSVYTPGRRSPDWVKIKAVNRLDTVIVGWTPGRGGRGTTLGALIVAVVRDGTLTYAGHVGTGFTARVLEALAEMLAPLETSDPPIEPPPPAEVDLRGVRWVRPELVASVEYLEFTSKGRMRAASFKGLRDDVAPEDCVAEPPAEGRQDR